MEFICNDCPRRCGALRTEERGTGLCASPAVPRIARAAAHFGEEPCISGTGGSGAVFFTGCNLLCAFCQNREISRGEGGKPVGRQEFRDMLLRLRDTGVHNINLVTPTHYTRFLSDALDGLELGIPVVWNSSGYESVESLRRMEGLVQVYLPDLKYMRGGTARRYSGASDYPEAAAAAIGEMFRQTGPYRLGEDGMLRSGVMIRHLILPDNLPNSMEVMDFVERRFSPGDVLFSLMSQYTPVGGLEGFPELRRTLSREESRHMYRYMLNCGITDGYFQDLTAATGEMIPAFDLTGL